MAQGLTRLAPALPMAKSLVELLPSYLAGSTCFVTGAGGFVGLNLCKALLGFGVNTIMAIDLFFLPECTNFYATEAAAKRVKVCKGDITDAVFVRESLKGCSLGFHVASYGMSGAAMLAVDRVYAVNVTGTDNVLDACLANNVQRLVYVSTYNVVFNGQTIVAGRNTLPYVPSTDHLDAYSRTKCLAEQRVLAANGAVLRTCAVRPAGIYGEGEHRHFARILRVVNQGLGFFAIGDQATLCDWVHVDNLVHVLLLAAVGLAVRSDRVAGRAYFASDNFPLNNFDFVKRILRAPWLFTLRVPMFAVAVATEFVHRLVARVYIFEPFLTRAEVVKVGASHYMSMEDTHADLDYTPLLAPDVAMDRAAQFFAPLVLSSAASRTRFFLVALTALFTVLVCLVLFWLLSLL
eukprot:m.232284 g.232284  ORF g.232284 m.232284 type:complete len:406 (-) comp18665_c0_seq1:28-1245(-)